LHSDRLFFYRVIPAKAGIQKRILWLNAPQFFSTTIARSRNLGSRLLPNYHDFDLLPFGLEGTTVGTRRFAAYPTYACCWAKTSRNR
jgi:hypothetical protein